MWFNVYDGMVPSEGKLVLCYCPSWCASEYQVAYWNESCGFYYLEQPNNGFNQSVKKWSYLVEHDSED